MPRRLQLDGHLLTTGEQDGPEQWLVPGEVLGHPQHPHPPFPTGQELVDGMETLDLVPAETSRPEAVLILLRGGQLPNRRSLRLGPTPQCLGPLGLHRDRRAQGVAQSAFHCFAISGQAGASVMTVQSTLTVLHGGEILCRALTSSSRLSAPARAGLVSGNKVPMSPAPAAPSNASMMAWQTTSASLWPSKAGPAQPLRPVPRDARDRR